MAEQETPTQKIEIIQNWIRTQRVFSKLEKVRSTHEEALEPYRDDPAVAKQLARIQEGNRLLCERPLCLTIDEVFMDPPEGFVFMTRYVTFAGLMISHRFLYSFDAQEVIDPTFGQLPELETGFEFTHPGAGVDYVTSFTQDPNLGLIIPDPNSDNFVLWGKIPEIGATIFDIEYI